MSNTTTTTKAGARRAPVGKRAPHHTDAETRRHAIWCKDKLGVSAKRLGKPLGGAPFIVGEGR